MALVTDSVESFPHVVIAEEPIDTQGLPFDESFYRSSVPVVLEHAPGISNDVLRSPSEFHGRSYEVVLPDHENTGNLPTNLWRDQFGNTYTTLVTKGNNFSKAEMIKSATAPSGFVPYGLQEGDALLRVLRASRLMRENGIETEWIVRVEEPKQLWIEGEFVSPTEYKRRLVSGLIELGGTALTGAGVQKPDKNGQLSLEEAAEAAAAIRGMDFFITYRAMATPYRVSDIANRSHFNYTALEKVFKAYSSIAPNREKDFKLLGLPIELNMPVPHMVQNRHTDIEKYFSEALPKLMALNLARMHNLGLTHAFPHLGNYTALGGLVDLDSVKGLAIELDDPPMDSSAVARDFRNIFDGEDFRDFMHTASSSFEGSSWNPQEDFCNNFLTTYLNTRGLDTSDQSKGRELVQFLLDVAHELESGVTRSYFRDYLKKITYPLVGEIIESKTEEVLKNTLKLEAHRLAGTLYISHILDYEYALYECEYLPNPEVRPPTHQEVIEAIKEYLGGNLPDAEFVGSDVFEETIAPHLVALRYEQINERLDELSSEVRKRLMGTALEKLDKSELTMLYIIHSMELVEDATHDYEIPDPNKVWNIMASAFQSLYLNRGDGKIKEPAEVATYFMANSLLDQVPG